MGNERQIYLTIGVRSDTLIVIFTSINALSNLVGRLICASAQDRTSKKHLPYYVMTIASLLICGLAILVPFGGGARDHNSVYSFDDIHSPILLWLWICLFAWYIRTKLWNETASYSARATAYFVGSSWASRKSNINIYNR